MAAVLAAIATMAEVPPIAMVPAVAAEIFVAEAEGAGGDVVMAVEVAVVVEG